MSYEQLQLENEMRYPEEPKTLENLDQENLSLTLGYMSVQLAMNNTGANYVTGPVGVNANGTLDHTEAIDTLLATLEYADRHNRHR